MDQLNIYDLLFPKYKITKPIRLIECFAGIGSQAKSLERLQKEFGFRFEHYRVIEFDKYAIASYNAIHGTSFETSNITQIHADDLGITNTIEFDYIMTYSFPCQDLSLAGKRKGMTKGSNTRSGLLWEVERILDECDELPQILLMENVPQVISSQNMNDFLLWQKKLENLGYTNYVSLLNAKDYGIPQNRNRCFMISILGQYNYSFPKGFELKLRLKDMLEDDVDEKYYLSEKMINGFIEHARKQKEKGNSFCWKPKTEEDIASTLTAHLGFGATDNSIVVRKCGYRQSCVEVENRGLIIPEATKKGYDVAEKADGVYVERPHQKRGCVQKGMIQMIKTSCDDIGVVVGSTQKHAAISYDGVCPTLTSSMGAGGGHVPMHNYNLRIRKLTPLECWRLMGFDDEDFHKAEKVNSNTQLYKQAGNSIVVDVLYYIFREFFV